jgi:hypothetical protein
MNASPGFAAGGNSGQNNSYCIIPDFNCLQPQTPILHGTHHPAYLATKISSLAIPPASALLAAKTDSRAVLSAAATVRTPV